MKRRTLLAGIGGTLAVGSSVAIGHTSVSEAVTTESDFRVIGYIPPPILTTLEVTRDNHPVHARFDVFVEAEIEDAGAPLSTIELELYNEDSGGELVNTYAEDVGGDSAIVDENNAIGENQAVDDTFTIRAVVTDENDFRDDRSVLNSP